MRFKIKTVRNFRCGLPACHTEKSGVLLETYFIRVFARREKNYNDDKFII